MIFVNASDTSYLSLQNINKNIPDISKYIIYDYVYIIDKIPFEIKDISNDEKIIKSVALYGLSKTEDSIPYLSSTLFNDKQNWSCVDFRQYVNSDKDNKKINIKNENEFNFQLYKHILSNLWFVNKTKELKELKFPCLVYSSWISDNLTKRFGLDLSDSFKLKILGLIFYNSLFVDKLDKEEIEKIYIKYKNEFILNEELLYEIFDKVGNKLSNIESFCSACYEVTGNIRLKGFNLAVLNTIIANSWFGINNKENIFISLEHPPTWISIVYMSLNNKNFNKSSISQISDKLDRKDKGTTFSKSVKDIVNDLIIFKE